MSNYEPIGNRTFNFAIEIVALCSFLEMEPGVHRTLSNQLLRSGTSIGANVAESQSAQSNRDFLHKLETALKAARESFYWLKLLLATKILSEVRLMPLITENEEIIKILVSSTKKVKERMRSQKNISESRTFDTKL